MQRKKSLESHEKERILITGNAGSLGKALTKRLLQDNNFHIIGVDRRPLDSVPAGVEHYALDLRRKSAIEVLRRIKPSSIIHLGVIRNPQTHRGRRANAYYFNLESTTQLLRFAESVRVRKFVFLSTANLYGPSVNTAGILTEDAPLHGANRSPEIRDLVSLDMMIQSFFWKQPKTETIILRPCHIVGPDLRNAPTRYLELDTIPTILGFDPLVQFLHVSDLITAIMLSVKSKVRGIFNLAGPDVAPLARVIKALARPSILLPETVLRIIMASTFFSRRSYFPIGELDHLKYSCVIDDSRARVELGFKPKTKMSAIITEMRRRYEKRKSQAQA